MCACVYVWCDGRMGISFFHYNVICNLVIIIIKSCKKEAEPFVHFPNYHFVLQSIPPFFCVNRRFE